MKARNIAKVTLAGLLAIGLVGGASGAGAKGKKSKMTVVGKDAAGDWGSNADSNLGPLGEPIGQDLVEAAIGMGKKGKINFVIKLTSLPENGGMPEATRYTWNLAVNGKQVELDGKWSNYTRGACDPTSGNCPPPRDPGMQPFLVRGDCASNGATVQCRELGIVQASFDAAAGTITIPVPAKMIKAKPGAKITGATQPDSGFGGVSAAPSAFYSHSSAPYDTLAILKTFRVPKKR